MDHKSLKTVQSDVALKSHVSKPESIKCGEVVEVADENVDPESSINEKQVLRKMDRHLIPILAVLYLMSFLDRGNIGNAKIEGLVDDLKMTGQQYNWCLSIFFLSYSLLELPCNLLLKRLKPSICLPTIMVSWGIVMTLMGLVQNFRGLFIARFFLGVTEGGLYPGLIYYITLWYRRDESQYRQALFYCAASSAGAFSGLLAYLISKMDGIGGLEGWRWIFILEGLLTLVAAFAAYFLVHDTPETAKFLTEEEKVWVINRLKYQGSAHIAEDNHFQWKYVKAAFTDWQVYTAMFMNFGLLAALYGISLFLPTIVKGLGYTAAKAQLLTVPIYISAAIMSIIAANYSDRFGQRSPFLLFFTSVACVGYIITICGSIKGIPGLVYAGVFLVVFGIYTAFPGNITWISNNLSGTYKRSTGLVIHVAFGNLGGAVSSNIYHSNDAPRYLLGHALSLGFVLIAMVAALTLRFNYQLINKQRDEAGPVTGYSEEQLVEMGDKAPTYRYML